MVIREKIFSMKAFEPGTLRTNETTLNILLKLSFPMFWKTTYCGIVCDFLYFLLASSELFIELVHTDRLCYFEGSHHLLEVSQEEEGEELFTEADRFQFHHDREFKPLINLCSGRVTELYEILFLLGPLCWHLIIGPLVKYSKELSCFCWSIFILNFQTSSWTSVMPCQLFSPAFSQVAQKCNPCCGISTAKSQQFLFFLHPQKSFSVPQDFRFPQRTWSTKASDAGDDRQLGEKRDIMCKCDAEFWATRCP